MSLNWENLVSKNRAKSIGVAWTPEEAEAIRNGEVTAEELRTEALEKVIADKKKDEVKEVASKEETPEVKEVKETGKSANKK